MERLPEFLPPKLGKFNNDLRIEANVPQKANGVLYVISGFFRWIVTFRNEGHLVYEYKLLENQRTRFRSYQPVAPGEVFIEVQSRLAEPKQAAPLDV